MLKRLRAGNYWVNVDIQTQGEDLIIHFPFNLILKDEIKAMEGARWLGFSGGPKAWSIKNTKRNWFQLGYLEHPSKDDPLNPYYPYFTPLLNLTKEDFHRPVYSQQVEMVNFVLTRRQCELAAEMGVGKTLAIIEVMERCGLKGEFYYIAPKSTLYAIYNEFRHWKAKITPKFYTYDALRELVKNWPKGKPAPQFIVFDEASRLKNHTAQRSQAAKYIADSMREEYGRECYIVEMSGSPAPKAPTDWYWQAEIACPGFIKEGDFYKFRNRLAIIEKAESLAGGQFPKLVAWKDDTEKCNKCGRSKDDIIHDLIDPEYHPYMPVKDEVSFLYKRLQGLVFIKKKEDCLDLPDKVYKIIQCEPTQQIKNLAEIIKTRSPTAIKALTLLRELSDGFQYKEEVVGKKSCEVCNGVGNIINPEDNESLIPCDGCHGEKVVDKLERIAKHLPCPKDQVILDLLEDHEDAQRIVIYAGFTGSLDRVSALVVKAGWDFIRVDGKGFRSSISNKKPEELLELFQDRKYNKKIAFVGQPGAAGLGLNLTASPTIVYYSNDFNWESRVQSEDRIHRLGMDKNRGATIIDIVHLETDLYVLENLRKKKKLEKLTLGELIKGTQNER